MAIGRKIKPYQALKSPIKQTERQRTEDQRQSVIDSRNTLDKQKEVFGNLGTDNIFAGTQNMYAGAQNTFAGAKNQFANLENTAEDLTVNTQQADFEREQSQQNQANIMQGLQGSVGSSGVAGLAQSLANAGTNQARQSSASIGQQESANQRMAAQQAGSNQMASAQGAASADQMRMQGASNQQQMVLGGAERQQNTLLQGAADARSLEYQKVQGMMALEAGQLSQDQASLDSKRKWYQTIF